ncbi:MAG: asparagine synthase (glutamine-hydrolyzing) [Acidobacteriota bacterium]|nr:asparagine synthase (glutamine-hydrolyzing) [Blastocatellia bacterium]MDW8411330.1 asparagine synthase (glutamine-hydrolyzing) [Acidobacteriota bacterium]
MCGICGIYKYGKTAVEINSDLLVAMRDRMVHRGPDDAGIYISADRRIGLGHRRLSILDLSAAGRQPMANEDASIWVSFNGEIYNHRKFRSELIAKGHRYRSETDTETLLHLYEERGIDFLQAIEGMFAIALWDSKEQRLILARDRLGIKPLYYAELPGQVIFASEIKALLVHPQVTRDIDEEALYHYLTFLAVPPPKTLFTGIRKLPAGHYLIYDKDGRGELVRYWDAIVARPSEKYSEGFCIDRIRSLLTESVEQQMMSDVPFGVFLSGGVDSSANVALMAQCSEQPVKTFTVGFQDASGFNELEYARQIAHEYGTDHHEIIISHEDVVDFLPELIFHQDEPIADPVCVPLYYVSRLARENATIVVQVGEGSDEIFSGYSAYIDYLNIYEHFWNRLERLPLLLRKAVGSLTMPVAGLIGEFLPRGRKIFPELLRRMAAGEDLFWGSVIVYDELSKRKLLSRSYAERVKLLSSYSVAKEYLDRIRAEKSTADFLEQMIYLELKLRLAELLLMRVDKITMATSVEARVPFLDRRLVEFAMNIPRELRYKNGQAKYVLKKALEGVIPDNIIYRKKQGFGLPIKEWFVDRMYNFVESTLLRSPLVKRKLFNYDFVRSMLFAHRLGKIDYSFQLWSLLNLTLWYEHWIEGHLVALESGATQMKRTE